MKRFKRVFSLMLALVMALAMNITVLANEPEKTYTITINNAASGHTYEAYQIFTGDLDSSEKILSNVEWGSSIPEASQASLIAALKADKTIGGSFTSCNTAADVAKAVGSFSDKSTQLDAFADIVEDYLSSSAGTLKQGAIANGKYPYTLSGLSAGYYLIKDKDKSIDDGANDAYSKFMLQLVDDVNVEAKSDVPSVEKKVWDSEETTNAGYGAGYGDTADWSVGDAVPFKLIGTVPEMDGYETYKYVFHDTLSAGLTFNSSSVEVYLSGSKDAADSSMSKLTSGYAVNSTGLTDGCSFEVVFNDLTEIADVAKYEYIIVKYTANLNKDAVVGTDDNTNKVHLEFSNNPNYDGTGEPGEPEEPPTGETPADEVFVFTYELDTKKIDGDTEGNGTPTTLKDAKFVLYRKNTSNEEEYAGVDSNGKITKWEKATGSGEDIAYPEGSTLISGNDGLFKIAGLDEGTYYLREIEAPDGYNLLESDLEVVITATIAEDMDNLSEYEITNLGVTSKPAGDEETKEVPGKGTPATGVVNITVANNKGATLPETGGIGTTIFYVLGAVLMIGAGVTFIVRRRAGSES